MKNYCPKGLATLRSASDRLGFLTALTTMLLAAPSIAAERNITNIELEKSHDRLELKLTADKAYKGKIVSTHQKMEEFRSYLELLFLPYGRETLLKLIYSIQI